MELEQLRERFVTQLQQGEERLKELDGTIESQEKAIESFEKKIAVEEEELLAIDDGESSIAPGAVLILSDWLTPIFYVKTSCISRARGATRSSISTTPATVEA